MSLSNSKDASCHWFAAAYDSRRGDDAVALGPLMKRRRRVRPRMKKEVERQRYMRLELKRYTRVGLQRYTPVGLQRKMQAGMRFV